MGVLFCSWDKPCIFHIYSYTPHRVASHTCHVAMGPQLYPNRSHTPGNCQVQSHTGRLEPFYHMHTESVPMMTLYQPSVPMMTLYQQSVPMMTPLPTIHSPFSKFKPGPTHEARRRTLLRPKIVITSTTQNTAIKKYYTRTP